MKNKFLLLAGINLKNIFSFIKPASKSKVTSKKQKILLGLLFAVLLVYFSAVVVFMTILLFESLEPMGLGLLIPAFYFIAASMAILITCVFSARGFLYDSKDLEMLFALPLSHRTIFYSKAFLLYAYDLIFSIVLLGVSGVTYLILAKLGAMAWVTLIIGIFTAPLIPLALGMAMSYAVGLAVRKLKYKNVFSIILTLVFAAFFISFSSFSNSLNDYFVKYGAKILPAIKKYYYPAGLFIGGFEGNILDTALFAVINAAPAFLLLPIVSSRFASIVSSYKQSRLKSDYTFRSHKKTSKLNTCFFKEIKKVFSSSMYLMNSGVGVLMLVMLTFSASQVRKAIGVDDSYLAYFALGSMLLILFCVTMNSTTSCTFSLEAKTLWIYKSAPIDVATVFEAKALANCVLYSPFIVIFAALYSVLLNFEAIYIPFIIMIPFLGVVSSSYLGLIYNLAYTKTDWTNETHAIKQSMSVFLSMMTAIGANALFILLAVLMLIYTPITPFEFMLSLFALFVAITLLLRRLLYGWGVKKFSQLI
ncbi:MAG: hypothetical protein WC143_05495 [Eubacteriales bacterium]